MKTTECGCLCHTTLKGLAESAIQLFPCEHCGSKPISEESWEKSFDEKFVGYPPDGTVYPGMPTSFVHGDVDEIKSFIASFVAKAHAEGERQVLNNVGMLRQWLNEDRIKDFDRFVTNEELEHWLKDKGDK